MTRATPRLVGETRITIEEVVALACDDARPVLEPSLREAEEP
jgi:hypothetical protein